MTEQTFTPVEQACVDYIKEMGKVNLPFLKDIIFGGSVARTRTTISKLCHLGVVEITDFNYVSFINGRKLGCVDKTQLCAQEV